MNSMKTKRITVKLYCSRHPEELMATIVPSVSKSFNIPPCPVCLSKAWSRGEESAYRFPRGEGG